MSTGEVTKFAPSVVLPGGRTVQPEGWMWVLGFAFGGCQWAVDTANTPEFKDSMRKSLSMMRDREIESEIAALEARIAQLKAGANPSLWHTN